MSQREILELVNSLVEEGGPWGALPDASEGCGSEIEYNYRTELGSESDNKLTFEVLESGVELTSEQKVLLTISHIVCEMCIQIMQN